MSMKYFKIAVELLSLLHNFTLPSKTILLLIIKESHNSSQY